jgi:hypothetical protein
LLRWQRELLFLTDCTVGVICVFVQELKFTDTPDYAFMTAQLQLPVDQVRIARLCVTSCI